MINNTKRALPLMMITALALGACDGMKEQAKDESNGGVATFSEINVERLNIMEPNGKYRLVLSNEERFPGLFMDGQEFEHHSRKTGGMLFFNDEGDEVGGLTFSGEKAGDGYSANAGIMFDQFKQDQTVGLSYSDRNGSRYAGLRVWDRPDYSIKPLFEYSDRAAKAQTDEEKNSIRQEMIAYAQDLGGLGAERLFAGKVKEDAIVKLADKEGRPRLVLKVDANGEPSIDFLDSEGKVIRTIAGAASE
ncbi:hypothetical protein [Kordiimonas sp.]|uniref:hypothetical protein n=1 Tax=Kordiimonas sp. TaxID=1970157 RepID=UPI003A944697